ncbi:MAG: twin-arginine translocation signal domain-containing protein, partial [Mycobacterium sp.]|nr:twin-arginine translocation signal domain-containing protein [Mycobacterium sp.]
MDRRDFLKAGGVAVGGLALGLSVAEPSFADGAPTMTDLGGTVGVTDHDLDPRLSALVAPAEGALLIDQDYRSVGLAFTRNVAVKAVRLTSDRSAHRLNARDLAVYTSADNEHWTKRSAEVLDLGATIWLYGIDVQARYVKVHCYREGAAAVATFGHADPQQLISAYSVPAGAFVGGGGTWSHRIAITIANPGGRALVDRAVYVPHEALGTSGLVGAGILRTDLADLRFADAKGRQLHAYDDGAGIFVRIPSLPPRQATDIYAYTGNPEAESVLADAGALQVEYGHRTYQPQVGKSEAGLTLSGEVHPFALPDGTLLM